MEQLYRTPLFEEHVALKAKMAPFDIWEMPIQYSGIIDEWGACRKSAAVFDTCHMGEFRMKGDIADSGIEDAVTLSVGTIPVGKSRYGFLLNDDGGVIDDLIVYRIANDELMIVVNAGTIDNDFKVIQSRLSSGVIFTNESEKTAKLDVQGPLSRDVMMETLGIPVKDLKYFQFFETKALDVPAIVSRTGYTGELGYEIYIERSQVVELWRRLLSDARVKPAGLGARDILRLEMGYSLYGNDLDEEISPLEAGLQMFVDYKKDFLREDRFTEPADQGASEHEGRFQNPFAKVAEVTPDDRGRRTECRRGQKRHVFSRAERGNRNGICQTEMFRCRDEDCAGRRECQDRC